MAFSPRNNLGCLLNKKGLQGGGGLLRAPQDPSSLLPCSLFQVPYGICLFTNVTKPRNNFKIIRYYLTLSHLKQIYYSLIYPYISSYAILAWGSTYKTYIQNVQSKQNQAISYYFAKLLVNKRIALSLC